MQRANMPFSPRPFRQQSLCSKSQLTQAAQQPIKAIGATLLHHSLAAGSHLHKATAAATASQLLCLVMHCCQWRVGRPVWQETACCKPPLIWLTNFMTLEDVDWGKVGDE